MSDQLSSNEISLRVAIIGSGPSGFYTAGELLKQKDLNLILDMYDRLPVPHGLVRYGVAPDHQKIKSVTKIFDRTAANPNFRFFGNVTLGTDITHDELRKHYDQIVYAVGAPSDRRLNIPGEDSTNSLSATRFVAWYNGHPDAVDLEIDLSCESAVVVGAGNVALDVARVLAKSVDDLRETDIADHALEQLAESQIKDIYIIARRGPAQLKFTVPELREFGHLASAAPVVDPQALVLDSASQLALEGNSVATRNMELLREFAATEAGDKPRRVHFKFLMSPTEILSENGQISAVQVEQNELQATDSGYLNAQGTGQYQTIPAGLVLRSVGYRGIPLDGVPFDPRRGVIPNEMGQVMNPELNQPVPGEYVVGWIKRGPSGVIGTNKPDAVETVKCMLADLPTLKPASRPEPEAINALLNERGVRVVSIADWQKIDQAELARGEREGRPRVKMVDIEEMLAGL